MDASTEQDPIMVRNQLVHAVFEATKLNQARARLLQATTEYNQAQLEFREYFFGTLDKEQRLEAVTKYPHINDVVAQINNGYRYGEPNA